MTGLHISWHSVQECCISFRFVPQFLAPALATSTPMALVASHPLQLPTAFSIGTRRAFEQGYEYKYTWKDALGGYVCDHQTTTKVDGEVMAIQLGYEAGTTWYIASEGVMVDGQAFAARQHVFRTSERFWEPGKHQWQLNARSSSTNRNNSSWDNNMVAYTEVPENIEMVEAAVGLAEIADDS